MNIFHVVLSHTLQITRKCIHCINDFEIPVAIITAELNDSILCGDV